MSELIPEITITEFRVLITKRIHKLRELKSFEVTADGEYLFTYVNGNLEPSSYLKTQTEYKCQTANVLGGIDPRDALKPRETEHATL